MFYSPQLPAINEKLAVAFFKESELLTVNSISPVAFIPTIADISVLSVFLAIAGKYNKEFGLNPTGRVATTVPQPFAIKDF